MGRNLSLSMIRKITNKAEAKARKRKTLQARAKAFGMEIDRLEKRAKKGLKL